MSRRRKALITAAFSYAQFFFGIASSFYITRYLVRTLGNDLYGLWLASGALLAYAALADLGIFGVIPWLIAEADGAKDDAKMRSLLAHGLVVGVLGGILYFVVVLVLWMFFLPLLLHLTPGDEATLRGPIAVVAVTTAIGYPLRLFAALRSGLQDVKFVGAWAVGSSVLGVVLIIGLSRLGFRLYAVAIGASVPPVVVGLASLVRTFVRDRGLLRAWPCLRWSDAHPILVGGVGGWLGDLGWQLAFATDAVIIAALGHRELVPIFVVTSRLGLTLMQFGWALPDSASVGLAQLNAEGDRDRVTSTVSALLRMHLVLAGGVAVGVLAANAGLVRVWIGPELYGGTRLNGIFAIDIVVLSVVHALCVPAAVLGRRLSIGLATLANGAAHLGFALVLGKKFGLEGVAAATFLSALVTTLPLGARLLSQVTTLRARGLQGVVAAWALRALPCAAVAALGGWLCAQYDVAGRYGPRAPLLFGAAVAIVVGLVYLYSLRALIRELPFPAKVRRLVDWAFRAS